MQEGEGVEGAGEGPSSLRRQGSASGQYVSRHPQAYRKTLPGKSEQSLRHARSCESGAGTFHQCMWICFGRTPFSQQPPEWSGTGGQARLSRLPLAVDGRLRRSRPMDARARHAQHEMPLQAWQSEAALRAVRSRLGGRPASSAASTPFCLAPSCAALLCSASLRVFGGGLLTARGQLEGITGGGRNLDREARDVGGWMYRVSKSDAVDGAMMMGQESSPTRQ